MLFSNLPSHLLANLLHRSPVNCLENNSHLELIGQKSSVPVCQCFEVVASVNEEWGYSDLQYFKVIISLMCSENQPCDITVM